MFIKLHLNFILVRTNVSTIKLILINRKETIKINLFFLEFKSLIKKIICIKTEFIVAKLNNVNA